MSIVRGSDWVHDETGLPHKVVLSTVHEVISWSAPVKSEEIGGFTFRGSPSDFLANFKPIKK
jgi:hypothetical protein